MDFFTGATTIALIHLMAVASPGPDFAMVMRNSLSFSRRAGVVTSLGFVLGAAVHFTYCLLGIGLIISQSVMAFNAIKLLGAAYLIYIGVKSLRAKPMNMDDIKKSKGKKMNDLTAIRCGFITNVLNPKAAMYFLSVFTMVISPETPLSHTIGYGVVMAAVMMLWFSMVAIIFSNKQLKKSLIGIQHWIERTFGGALVALGIKVAATKM